MQDKHINNINQLKEIIKVTKSIEFKAGVLKEKYQWIDEVLGRFRYFSLRKKDRTIIREYIKVMTGLKKAQITRLVQRKKKLGVIIPHYGKRHRFKTVYTTSDVARLIQTDNDHERLSGKATKTIFKREYEVFGHQEYERLSKISVSHIYNLRGRKQYLSHSTAKTGTKAVSVPIGERIKPNPRGRPGFLRVDTVHQGDLDKEKGVYHINLVDEVTQWEVVVATERISEHHLELVIIEALKQFPFKIINFHSDNGGEYINKVVAKLLNKLLIRQTKTRTYHSNDNALAETKNGAVVRKHMGYTFIKSTEAGRINAFYRQWFNPYLNYHRPCGFPAEIVDKKGKIKKIYPVENYHTPYEKLRSLKDAKQYLDEGVEFKDLDRFAYDKSDNEFAVLMKKAKVELFKSFKTKLQLPTLYASCLTKDLRLIP